MQSNPINYCQLLSILRTKLASHHQFKDETGQNSIALIRKKSKNKSQKLINIEIDSLSSEKVLINCIRLFQVLAKYNN